MATWCLSPLVTGATGIAYKASSWAQIKGVNKLTRGCLWEDFLFFSVAKKKNRYLTKQDKSKMKKLIAEIKPFSAIGITIRVRAALRWRPRMFDSTDYSGLHYLLVDEKGSSIHAMIEECYYAYMPMLMQPGKIYDISRFSSIQRTIQLDTKSLPMLQFCISQNVLNLTKSKKNCSTFQNTPSICDNLETWLPRQANKLSLQLCVSEDLYRCVKSVKAPQVIAVDNPKEKETRTDLFIQFLGREELKISLWADVARSFPVQEIAEMPPPVLAVFTGMRISIYEGRVSAYSTPHTCFVINPDIKERKQYEAEFSKNGDKVNVSSAFSSLMSPGIIDEVDKRNVSELNALDPSLHATKSVYCFAVVRRFFVDKGWFYRCCPVDKYYKHMLKKEEADNRYICNAHGEQKPKLNCKVYVVIQDDYDQARVTLMGRATDELFGATCEELLNNTLHPVEITLPTQITSKADQKFIFEIRISQRGELFVRSSHSYDLAAGTSEGDICGSKKVQKVVEFDQPSLHTPDKIIYERKRGSQDSARQLFASETEKNAKETKMLEAHQQKIWETHSHKIWRRNLNKVAL